jgi:DnaJ-class molecular chaperone
MTAPISFIKAVLGGELMIKSIDGKNVTVKIPAEKCNKGIKH